MKAWEPWSEVIASSKDSRMLEKLTLRTPLTIDATKEQDLKPRPCSNNDHPSVLAHEMMAIEPDEKPSRKLTWKPTEWISHIMCRSHDDHLPMPIWETWFYSTLGVPIPTLSRDRALASSLIFMGIIYRGQYQSAALHTHEWFVYRLSSMLHSRSQG